MKVEESMKLVIVESPAKCKTIKRYLGDEYEVLASLGSIRELATSGKEGLGVDIVDGFKPTYIVDKKKLGVVKQLKQKAKQAEEVILATDPDREGEAISWHLAKVLNLDVEKVKRLEFHEITRESITNAINNPRTINGNLVASQETRRILDRIIGFKLSKLLWKNISSRSAGRVQSATLKLIFDRDKEIEDFVPEEYWQVLSKIYLNNKDINLSFVSLNDQPFHLKTEEDADTILDLIKDNQLEVLSIDKRIKFKESKPPFITSTLQQEAFSKLKFKTKRTQSIAQMLYEGIDINGEHTSLITYMRTDSTRLSPTYIARAQGFIVETFGQEYLGTLKKGKTNENVQDGHEAIRPSSNHKTPESVKEYLTKDQYSLYKLIYNRTLASLMKAKKEELMVITLGCNGVKFKFEISKTLFKGWEALIHDNEEENLEVDSFPNINIGEKFDLVEVNKEQKFTQAPTPYSEAKIVKLMEDVGIGRPSTYAYTIDLLQKRNYVSNNKGILTITEQGKKTSNVLNKYFSDIVDANYTAEMEKKLDRVQIGEKSRVDAISGFYENFIKEFDYAKEHIYIDPKELTGEKCPECGGDLIYKIGKNGEFIGCNNFPKCHYIKPTKQAENTLLDETCPECGAKLIKRVSRKGKEFIGCSNYPKCHYIKKELPKDRPEPEHTGLTCPLCGNELLKKKGKKGYFLGCSKFPKCKHVDYDYYKDLNINNNEA